MSSLTLLKNTNNLKRINIYLLLLAIVISIFSLNVISLNSPTNCGDIEIPNKYDNYKKKNIPKEISVLPEYQNIRCLGKIYNYEIILEKDSDQSGLIYNYIFYSTRFFFILKTFLLVWISLTFIFLRSKEDVSLQKLLLFLYLSIYFIGYDYNIRSFLDHVSIVLIIPFLLNKNESIHQITRIKFNNNVNLLRALSVILIIFYHLDVRLFSIGWIGVDIFFVISGYLISNIIISKLNEDKFSFKEFYIRRIKRILPALYFVLIFATPLALMLFTPKELYEFINTQVYSLLFISNFFLQNLDSYTSENTELYPLLHTWSLSIEEQFYIIFPLFLYIVYRYFNKNFNLIVNVIFLLSIIQHLLPSSPITQFYSTRFRLWEFIFGLLLMVKISNKSNYAKIYRFRLLFFTLSIFLFLLDDSYINNIFTKVIIFIAVSVFIYDQNLKFENKKLQNFLFNIGVISYSLYLIHQPLFAFIRKYFLINNYELNVYVLLSSLIFLYYLASFSFKNIENRFLNYSNKRTLLSVLFLFLINLSIYFYVINNPNFTNLSSSQLNEQFNDSRFIQIDGKNCYQRGINNLCKFNENESKSLLLIGNSLLEPFAFHLYERREEIPYKITFLIGHDYFANPTKFVAPNTLAEFTNFIEKNKFDVVIYGGFLSNEIELDYFSNKLKYIVDNNSKTILIYPIPSPSFNVPNLIIYDNYDTTKDLLYSSKDWFINNVDLNNTLDSIINNNITRVYPEEFLCLPDNYENCYATKDSQLIYYDHVHLTRVGSKEIANHIIRNIK